MTTEPERDDGTAEHIRAAGPRPPLPPEELADLRAVASTAWQRMVAAERRKRRRRMAYAAAAALVLGVAASWIWLRSTAPPAPPGVVAVVESGPPAALPIGATYTAVEPVALRMATGESVRLERGTRLRFVSSSRLELVDGALYLDSGATGSAADIEVRTALGLVREIGTQYEVRYGEDSVTVGVREGRVRFEHGAASSVVERGEQLRVRRDGTVVRGSVAPCGPEWSWASALAPALEIEGVTLAAYLEWIARETGCAVTYADDELARSAATIELHGSIAGFTPEESLEVVLPGAGLGHAVEGGAIRILRTRT
jgi:ferric-dicitrate binding protein FerR (iron transport regulator)